MEATGIEAADPHRVVPVTRFEPLTRMGINAIIWDKGGQRVLALTYNVISLGIL